MAKFKGKDPSNELKKTCAWQRHNLDSHKRQDKAWNHPIISFLTFKVNTKGSLQNIQAVNFQIFPIYDKLDFCDWLLAIYFLELNSKQCNLRSLQDNKQMCFEVSKMVQRNFV